MQKVLKLRFSDVLLAVLPRWVIPGTRSGAARMDLGGTGAAQSSLDWLSGPHVSSIHLCLSVFIDAFSSMKTGCHKSCNEDMGTGAGLHCRTIIWRVNVVTFCNKSFSATKFFL